MNKIILLLTVAVFLSCQPKSIDVVKSAGMTYYGANEGKKFQFGSDEIAQLAVDAILAYADGNFDFMNEISADTIMFFEPSMGKPIAVINPANEFLTQIQSPYDSITRFVFNAIPLKREVLPKFLGENAKKLLKLTKAKNGKELIPQKPISPLGKKLSNIN